MKHRRSCCFSITCVLILFCTFWLAGSSYALEPTPQASQTTTVRNIMPGAVLNIMPGALKGTVFSVQGKTLAGVEIMVKSDSQKIALKNITGKDGRYKFEGLKEGKYLLHIAGRKSGILNVTRKSKISNLDAVIRSRTSKTNNLQGEGIPSTDQVTQIIKLSRSFIIIEQGHALDSRVNRDGSSLPPGSTASPKPPPDVSP